MKEPVTQGPSRAALERPEALPWTSRNVIDLFRLASDRGAASAVRTRAGLLARDHALPHDWPFSQLDALYLVLDLWPEADLPLARRLAAVARESARATWRRLAMGGGPPASAPLTSASPAGSPH